MEDMDFLEEMMMKRAMVENADNKKEILQIQEENTKIINDLNKKISEYFNQEHFNEAIPFLERLKYYIAVDNAIELWIEKYIHTHL